GAFTYLQAGFAREMVCLHMCPYSRFQGVMFDADTATISYDARRGEPRGRRGAAKLAAATGGEAANSVARAGGDCVDCTICVQVCPTGIDIRDGLQYQCINCGLCADACDDVMTRVDSPTGLIRMASERELANPALPPSSVRADAWRRPRSLTYIVALVVFSVLGASMLANRTPLIVDVLRDRSALLREGSDGSIENAYTLKLMNLLERPREFQVTLEGPAGVRLAGRDTFAVEGGSVLAVPITVAAKGDSGLDGRQEIRFRITAVDEPTDAVTEGSSFLLP
ncbi:MAG TPA: 4Fe-4S dicluster domain-containing protein, partial [Opitutaceae bacterium]